MLTLIYSDVHGNLIAFEHMLKQHNDIDAFICLGDLINYGPWSNECVDLALSLNNSVILKGNHEQEMLDSKFSKGSALIKKFATSALANFERFDEISQFKSEHQFESFSCKHTILNEYIFPDSKPHLDKNYLIGHSHYQFEYCYKGFRLINVGSVGQNRQYINMIEYAIYNSETCVIELKSVKYDIGILIKQMRECKYDEECINYYQSKKRY